MDLVNVHRRIQRRCRPPEIAAVMPVIPVQPGNDAGGIRCPAASEAHRVRLVDPAAVPVAHQIFVSPALSWVRGPGLPDAAAKAVHGQVVGVPEIEIAHHVDPLGIGGPHPEHESGNARPVLRVAA